MCRKLSATSPSIIDRINSRSVSEQSLHIQIHHHFGFRLHLLWKCVKTKKCEIGEEHRKGIFRGRWHRKLLPPTRNGHIGRTVQFCLWVGFLLFLENKVRPCYKIPSLPSQLDEITTPRWHIRHLQEHYDFLRYPCHVHSVQKNRAT